jgi:hypothetical protein
LLHDILSLLPQNHTIHYSFPSPMSSTFSSRQDPSSSRTWWSLSSKLPNVANERQYSDKSFRQRLPKTSGINLNSIAAAIGLKPKKHPSLIIQPPPPPSPPPVKNTAGADGLAKHLYRPYSKSASSVHSQVDSPEPRTPEDGQRDTRQSLLTLSAIDSFGMDGSSVRHPNRLSGHSHSSVAEVGSKYRGPSMLSRSSYTSSSSLSNFHIGSELSPSSSKQSFTFSPDSPTQHLKSTFVLSFHLRIAYRVLDVGGQPEAYTANG